MKELEDYSWFPEVLRNQQTEFIGYIVTRFGIYNNLTHYFQKVIPRESSIVDLCSGSGEPAYTLFCHSLNTASLILTDKFPVRTNRRDRRCYFDTRSMDVLDFSFEEKKIYTMFNSFHHFTDEEKLKILRRIEESGAEAYIVELLSPDFICLLKVLFATTIGNFFLAPFVKPFSLTRLFLTYILPINLITIPWDGIISVLKSRTSKSYSVLLENENLPVNVIKIAGRLQSILVLHVEKRNEKNSNTLEF